MKQKLEDMFNKELLDKIRKAQPLYVEYELFKLFIDGFAKCGSKLRPKQETMLRKDCEEFSKIIFDKYLSRTFPDTFTYSKKDDDKP